jgi:hypothetical protein
MMKQFCLLLSTGLLFTLTLAARGPWQTKACDLLSQSDVQQVLQAQSDDGSPRVNAGILTSCTFRITGGGMVSILLRHDVARTWSASQRRRMTTAENFRVLDGFGDSAFVLDLHQSGAALCAYRGNYYLQVSIIRLGVSDHVLPATEELARRALANLDRSAE